MINPRTQALVTFPVEISLSSGLPNLEDTYWLTFACQLLQTKLLQIMRFRYGEVPACAELAPSFPISQLSKSQENFFAMFSFQMEGKSVQC